LLPNYEGERPDTLFGPLADRLIVTSCA